MECYQPSLSYVYFLYSSMDLTFFLRLIQFHLPVLRYSHDFWMLTPEQVSNYLRGYGVCPEHLVPENRLATLKAAVGYYEKFI